ncbi:aspartate/glutamate racemase family protein [Bavariicoccus seileri]|uniref:aspartate/glutamate racemase family protein n=1 Tax=Bavariicoccus seileri TaxID=549685 RepID=UPI0004222705|nr:aspartate/glutamate racemase family protein [Bavariicoccus seileri]
MSIAVMAGTPTDTEMGVNLIKASSLSSQQIIPVSISKNPREQTLFQTRSYDERHAAIKKIVNVLKKKNVSYLFVYCNSLSSAIDFELLADTLNIPIVTPFMIYKDIAHHYQKVGVLTANAQGSAGIEKVMVHSNPKISVLTVANISWVEAVEKKLEPPKIILRYGLLETIAFFENNRTEAIIIGCTHFPYFLADYQKYTELPCIDAGEAMIETMIEYFKTTDKH